MFEVIESQERFSIGEKVEKISGEVVRVQDGSGEANNSEGGMSSTNDVHKVLQSQLSRSTKIKQIKAKFESFFFVGLFQRDPVGFPVDRTQFVSFLACNGIK